MSTSARSRRGSRSSTKSPRTCKRPNRKPEGTPSTMDMVDTTTATEDVRQRLDLSDLVSDEITSARRNAMEANQTADRAADVAILNPTPENVLIANKTALDADEADRVLEDVERRAASMGEPLGVTPVGECPRHTREKLMSMTKKELDVLAKSLDIKSPYRYRKADLIENIMAVEAGRMPTAAPAPVKRRSTSPKRKSTPKKKAAAKKKSTTKKKTPAKKEKRKTPAKTATRKSAAKKKTTAKRKSPAKKKTTGKVSEKEALKDMTVSQLERKLKREGGKAPTGQRKQKLIDEVFVAEKTDQKDFRAPRTQASEVEEKKSSGRKTPPKKGRKTPTKKASGRKTPPKNKTTTKRKSTTKRKPASKRKSAPKKKATRKSTKK